MDLHDKFKGPQINRPYRTEMFMATYAVNPDTHLDHTQNTGKSKSKKSSSKYATKGRAWTQQHCSVGIRVCKYFVGEMAAPTLHANSVRDHGRNRHARSAEEEEENMDVEIKTEVDTSGEKAEPNPATVTASVCSEETAAAVLSTETSTDRVSRQEPLFHIFVSSTSENVVTSTADSATTTATSHVDGTTVQDKPRTPAVVSAAAPSAQRASKRAAIVLDQPPRKVPDTEEQKAKQRQLNIEKQAAAKRQLQSISGSSASNGKAAGAEESAVSFSVIKKKKTSIVEDTESAISHHQGDQNHSRSSSSSRSWPSGSRGDSNNDSYSRRDGRDSGNSGSNSRTSYSRYEAPSQGHSTTLYDTRRPTSSNSNSASSTGTGTANAVRMTETLSLAPPETSNNTGNIKVVHFIDQCLAIMKRHQQHMISARQRVLQAYSPVGNEFSNNLVESLAADIVQIIGPPTPPEVAPPGKMETAASTVAMPSENLHG